MAKLLDRLQASLGTTYRIECELQGGGMSRVFLATEVRLNTAASPGVTLMRDSNLR
jgi:hypothetical protein